MRNSFESEVAKRRQENFIEVAANIMQTIQVGCAIIIKGERLLIAQRKPGDSFGGYWEFPGGKQNDTEDMATCLKREVKEELAIEIRPRFFLENSTYEYPDKTIVLHFYLCDWVRGTPLKHDCHDFRWIFPEELRLFRLLPGDTDIMNKLILMKWTYLRDRTFGRLAW